MMITTEFCKEITDLMLLTSKTFTMGGQKLKSIILVINNNPRKNLKQY